MAKKDIKITEQNVTVVQYKRNKLRALISATKNRKNTKEKFDKLIELTNEYRTVTEALKNYGKNVEIQSEWLTPEYWSMLKDTYKFNTVNITKPKKTKKSTPQKTEEKTYWRITLSWSTPPENCNCSVPVENVKSLINTYAKFFPIKIVDESNCVYGDRIEASYTYEFEGDKKLYITILESAKHVLNLSSATERDICNVGIYGKKFDK